MRTASQHNAQEGIGESSFTPHTTLGKSPEFVVQKSVRRSVTEVLMRRHGWHPANGHPLIQLDHGVTHESTLEFWCKGGRVAIVQEYAEEMVGKPRVYFWGDSWAATEAELSKP